MRLLLDIRVEKVSVNTAFVRSPKFIRKASKESGKERVIVAIHWPRDPPYSGLPRLELLAKSGSGSAGLEIVKRAKPVEELDTAEILFTSKDTDDTKHRYDLEMTQAVAEAITVPVVAFGRSWGTRAPPSSSNRWESGSDPRCFYVPLWRNIHT